MTFEIVHCIYIPDIIEYGKFYISNEYEVTIHLCPCGCLQEVTIPIGKNQWRLKEIDGLFTIKPSILNKWCNSHYWLNDNKVIWQ